jgi:thiol-disulfide isomerase/thioredoxin
MSDSTGAPVNDPEHDDQPRKDYTLLLLAIPVIVVLALVAMGIFGGKEGGGGGAGDLPGQQMGGRMGGGRPKMGGVAPGEAAPEIRAEGWINGEPPQLAGRVVLLDLWASWCGPCRQKAPEFVELHRKYADKGVVFIGLSVEDKESLPQMEEFVKSAGITWPNGYQAEETISQLHIEVIPRAWIIGGDGKVLWNEDSEEPLEKAIERALAAVTK